MGVLMRLSRNNLLIIWIIPVILGLIIIYNFWTAISTLYPLGQKTYLIFDQLIAIGAAMFLGISIYWSILIYYIYLLQKSEITIQRNFTRLAGSGTAHLENAKKLIGNVLEDIKASEEMLKYNREKS